MPGRRSPFPEAIAGLGRGTLAFDIETIPRLGLDELPPRERDRFRRLAEEDARRAAGASLPTEAMVEESVHKALSLHPLTCRIVSLALHAAESGRELALVVAPRSDLVPPAFRVEEADLLASFWRVAARARRMVGFHSRRFDLPVLLARSAMLGVAASVDLSRRRHVDLLDVLAPAGGERRMSLELVGFAFGVPVKQTGHGSEVGRLVAAERWREIAGYNLEDARATAAIFRKLRGTWL